MLPQNNRVPGRQHSDLPSFDIQLDVLASAFAYCGTATLLAAVLVFLRGPRRTE
ncbi:hypothetical protein NKJ26_30010 [Mesorhizobium sp. M0152]|uniref:hypothetical protein n=1 Tax=Mesorhizobium sp. M0152 TaxID=2956898 RepID=UPI003334CD94